jgi:hypothetical protein
VHVQQRGRAGAALRCGRPPQLDFRRIGRRRPPSRRHYTLIETAKLNAIDPRAWLADVLARLPDHPAKRIAELLPWNWQPDRAMLAA